jgi:hypothetical protein
MSFPLSRVLVFVTFVVLVVGLWLPAPLALLIGVFVSIIAIRSSTLREENRR